MKDTENQDTRSSPMKGFNHSRTSKAFLELVDIQLKSLLKVHNETKGTNLLHQNLNVCTCSCVQQYRGKSRLVYSQSEQQDVEVDAVHVCSAVR